MAKTKAFLNAFLIAMIVCGLALVSGAYSVSDSPSPVSASNFASIAPSITWNRTYVGSGLLEADSVIQTVDGGFLLGGTTSTGPSQPTKIELVKVDSSGNPQWNKTYDAVGNSYSKWLIQAGNGAYALAGQYGGDFWLAKIDASGNILWNQTYSGIGFSWATSLTQTIDGGYALTGQTNFATDTGGGVASSSVLLVKTDALGYEQWSKMLGYGAVNSVIQTSDGGYAVAGTNNQPDYFLTKTNSTGDLQWSRTYGSQDEDVGSSVVQTSDGGFAVGGWMWLRSNGGGPNVVIVKTDASGNEQWTKYYGAGEGESIIKTSDGGFALAGSRLVKVDAAGNEQWEVSLEQQAYSVIQTQDSGYAIAGESNTSTGNPITYAWLAKTSSTLSTLTPLSPSLSSPVFSDSQIIVIGVLVAVVIVAAVVFLMFQRRLKTNSTSP
ncbi:MAG: hypothetical protein ABSA75_13235 [Candidatus Bathyarchaeia archaeon]